MMMKLPFDAMRWKNPGRSWNHREHHRMRLATLNFRLVPQVKLPQTQVLVPQEDSAHDHADEEYKFYLTAPIVKPRLQKVLDDGLFSARLLEDEDCAQWAELSSGSGDEEVVTYQEDLIRRPGNSELS